ncbi:hypothetical protein GGR51DRAFT_500240 [Nemania sp. FL0031]|nr:hypothetical protein GGR51DRAFT_500240 [Nemania sp. FL0031]
MASSQQELPTPNADLDLPQIQLPRIISAYHKFQLKNFSTFYYCGRSKHDRLYAVELQHLQVGGKAPLGARPGLFLHGGPSTSSPIVAATGDEMRERYNKYVHGGPNSDIILVGSPNPAYESNLMRGRITKNGMVAFSFKVRASNLLGEVDEVFSWIRVPKGSQPGLENGGYRLVRHPQKEREKLVPGMDHYCWMWWPTHDMLNEDETIAILASGKRWQMHTEVQLFTIEIISEEFTKNAGDLHARSILTTAARLFQMRGRTSHSGLAKAERRRMKAACR